MSPAKKCAESEAEVANPAASVRVLVVDNDKSHALAMKETLSRVGYPVDLAASGPEGAKKSRAGQLRHCRHRPHDERGGRHGNTRSLPGISPGCHGHHGDGTRKCSTKRSRAMQQGAFNFLEKPLNTDRLRTVTDKGCRSGAVASHKCQSPSAFGRKIRLRRNHLHQQGNGQRHRARQTDRADRRQCIDHRRHGNW